MEASSNQLIDTFRTHQNSGFTANIKNDFSNESIVYLTGLQTAEITADEIIFDETLVTKRDLDEKSQYNS